MSEEKIKEYIAALWALGQQHGIQIGSCGCCQSIHGIAGKESAFESLTIYENKIEVSIGIGGRNVWTYYPASGEWIIGWNGVC